MKTKNKSGKILSVSRIITAFFVFTSLSSCDKYIDTPPATKPVEFDVEGISLIRNDRYDCCEIPSEGCNFRIYGKGKYAKEAYVTTVIIYNNPLIENNTFGDNYESPTVDSMPDISGDWGRIDYLSVEPPYAMDVQIETNTDGAERIFIIQLGCCYTYSRILLTQPAE